MNKKNINSPIVEMPYYDVSTNAAATDGACAIPYAAPQIEIIDIEMDQNILGGSQVPDMPGQGW